MSLEGPKPSISSLVSLSRANLKDKSDKASANDGTLAAALNEDGTKNENGEKTTKKGEDVSSETGLTNNQNNLLSDTTTESASADNKAGANALKPGPRFGPNQTGDKQTRLTNIAENLKDQQQAERVETSPEPTRTLGRPVESYSESLRGRTLQIGGDQLLGSNGRTDILNDPTRLQSTLDTTGKLLGGHGSPTDSDRAKNNSSNTNQFALGGSGSALGNPGRANLTNNGIIQNSFNINQQQQNNVGPISTSDHTTQVVQETPQPPASDGGLSFEMNATDDSPGEYQNWKEKQQ